MKMSVKNRLERCYASPSDLDANYPATTRSYMSPVNLCPSNQSQLNGPLSGQLNGHSSLKNMDSMSSSLSLGLQMQGMGSSEPGTWSHGTSHQHFNLQHTARSQLLDSHDRFKPEKSQRRPVQKMKWSGASRWSRSLAGDLFSCSHPSQGLPSDSYMTSSMHAACLHPHALPALPALPLESQSRVSSMTIADVSPRIAVKKVLLLYEHAQYREAASFIQRLSVGTFRIILRELPMDVFVEAMPHSLPIMEALYAKVFTSDGPDIDLKPLKPESVVMHMVKFFSREDLAAQNRGRRDALGPFTSGCKKILEVIVIGDPKLMKTVMQRQRALNKAVEGMGQHGLVGTTDESLLPLHDALKLEFRRVVDTYKGALQKLEDLALSNKNNPKSVAHGPAPIQASHQRQLSLRAEEIQDRLIKNKSLLNVVEPTLDNHCLDILLGILQRRIQCDKESLFQFTQLRKEAGDINTDFIVAPLLMKYSRGCKQVVEMMREVAKEVGGCVEDYEDDSSDLSGYHSDSDSAIMTSGNSPYVSPRARYNFISRSVRSKAILRPSLLSSSSGVSSSGSPSSSSGSASGSGSGFMTPIGIMDGGAGLGLGSSSTTTNSTPTRPRHVKLKNQLHKNHSLVSSSSCGGSETSSSSGTGEEREEYLNLESTDSSLASCMDCVTLVSVPDDHVITQGLNHHCALGSVAQSLRASTGNLLESPAQKELPPNANAPAVASRPTNTNNSDSDRLVTELRNEINQLRRGLFNANATIQHLEQREKNLLTSSRLSEVSGGVEMGLFRNIDIAMERRAELIREYGAVYGVSRVEAMDALDALHQLNTADELKAKLLFSVVVLAFRAVQSNITDLKEQVESVLRMKTITTSTSNVNDNLRIAAMNNHKSAKMLSASGEKAGDLIGSASDGQPQQQHFHHFQPYQAKVLDAVGNYLQYSHQRFDLSKNVQQVATQLWTTLYDYPCLKTCDGLLKYIQTCVRLAWGLLNQTPACVLEYETRVYMREMHVRFHSSDHNSETIKTYLWPALLNGPNGPCLHKGVVIT